MALKRIHPTKDSWHHTFPEPKTGRSKWNILSVVIPGSTSVKCQRHHRSAIRCISPSSVSSHLCCSLLFIRVFVFRNLPVASACLSCFVTGYSLISFQSNGYRMDDQRVHKQLYNLPRAIKRSYREFFRNFDFTVNFN